MMNTSDHDFASPKSVDGFTLLEVVLTLSMSVVLMVLVGGAIQFYARDMNVRDMDIRQTQLAAGVMQMIEDDLRAALHGETVDTAPLEALLAATAGGEQPAGQGEDLSAAGIESGETEVIDEQSMVDLQSGVAVLESPGLIGNQYQIQIDMSRLPRLEEYVSLLQENTTDIDDIPSDIKTVAYFVQGSGMSTGVQDQLTTLDANTMGEIKSGLVRRSLDRAATVQAASTGSLSLLNQTGDLLAPEIVAVEFSYWDGTAWQIEWSSDDYGELPLAVSVMLTMRDQPLSEEESGSLGSSEVADPSQIRVFTHIVRLPLARIIELEEEEDLSGAGI